MSGHPWLCGSFEVSIEMLTSIQSYWMGESLKYFYLIFSEPDLISLDDWVFNTKAHPLSIPKPGAKKNQNGASKEKSKAHGKS